MSIFEIWKKIQQGYQDSESEQDEEEEQEEKSKTLKKSTKKKKKTSYSESETQSDDDDEDESAKTKKKKKSASRIKSKSKTKSKAVESESEPEEDEDEEAKPVAAKKKKTTNRTSVEANARKKPTSAKLEAKKDEKKQKKVDKSPEIKAEAKATNKKRKSESESEPEEEDEPLKKKQKTPEPPKQTKPKPEEKKTDKAVATGKLNNKAQTITSTLISNTTKPNPGTTVSSTTTATKTNVPVPPPPPLVSAVTLVNENKKATIAKGQAVSTQKQTAAAAAATQNTTPLSFHPNSAPTSSALTANPVRTVVTNFLQEMRDRQKQQQGQGQGQKEWYGGYPVPEMKNGRKIPLTSEECLMIGVASGTLLDWSEVESKDLPQNPAQIVKMIETHGFAVVHTNKQDAPEMVVDFTTDVLETWFWSNVENDNVPPRNILPKMGWDAVKSVWTIQKDPKSNPGPHVHKATDWRASMARTQQHQSQSQSQSQSLEQPQTQLQTQAVKDAEHKTFAPEFPPTAPMPDAFQQYERAVVSWKDAVVQRRMSVAATPCAGYGRLAAAVAPFLAVHPSNVSVGMDVCAADAPGTLAVLAPRLLPLYPSAWYTMRELRAHLLSLFCGAKYRDNPDILATLNPASAPKTQDGAVWMHNAGVTHARFAHTFVDAQSQRAWAENHLRVASLWPWPCDHPHVLEARLSAIDLLQKYSGDSGLNSSDKKKMDEENWALKHGMFAKLGMLVCYTYALPASTLHIVPGAAVLQQRLAAAVPKTQIAQQSDLDREYTFGEDAQRLAHVWRLKVPAGSTVILGAHTLHKHWFPTGLVRAISATGVSPAQPMDVPHTIEQSSDLLTDGRMPLGHLCFQTTFELLPAPTSQQQAERGSFWRSGLVSGLRANRLVSADFACANPIESPSDKRALLEERVGPAFPLLHPNSLETEIAPRLRNNERFFLGLPAPAPAPSQSVPALSATLSTRASIL